MIFTGKDDNIRDPLVYRPLEHRPLEETTLSRYLDPNNLDRSQLPSFTLGRILDIPGLHQQREPSLTEKVLFPFRASLGVVAAATWYVSIGFMESLLNAVGGGGLHSQSTSNIYHRIAGRNPFQ